MRTWHPDVCPAGGCVIETGIGQEQFVGILKACPHHSTMRLAFADREVHAAILSSCRQREAARWAAKKQLGLDKEHPGVPYRIESDGSFTLGVDQKGNRMPEWPDAVDVRWTGLFNAMSAAVEKVQKAPGSARVNNLFLGMALMACGTMAAIALASGDEYSLVGYGNDSTTEANTQISVTENASFTGLAAYVQSGGSGTNTFQFRDGGANGNNVCSVAGTGVARDSTPHTDSLTTGDLFNVAYTDTGTNSSCSWQSCNVTLASGHGNFHGAANYNGAVLDVGSSTRYFGLGGNVSADGEASETAVQWKCRGYTSWEALQVRCSANARVNNSDFTNRINANPGAALCRFSAGATGLVTDSTVGDTIASGDLIDTAITLDTGVQDLTCNFIVATLKSSGASEVWAVAQGGSSRTASATANYQTIGGVATIASALTDAETRIMVGFACVVSNLRCYLSANTYTGAGTLKLYVNGSPVLTTTITAGGGAGWYENTTDSVTIDANDELSFEIDEGSSGSITLHSVGVTFSPDTTGGYGSYYRLLQGMATPSA